MKKFLIAVCIIVAFIFGLMLFGYVAEPAGKTTAAEHLPQPPSVGAKQAILIDGKTGEVLFEKNADEKGYPASTTKIMTAMLTLEICDEVGADICQKVVIPEEAVGVEGSSLYLKKGDKKTIEELLYGVMLRSGNDGATALAATMGGNVKHFVKLMNERAEELGCTGTHFVNPSGLFDEDHYTTARDLATIARQAMKNKTFRQVVKTKSWKQYYNKNKTVFQYDGGTGIKIGFTKMSGRTLVASSSRQGESLICVVLADGNWFNDAYALMDYGYEVKGCDKDEE
ncbi:D-alanyl-D-alanine carboxypeptidase family protein [Ihubacter sp. rT4E-8]|uniref:D-alanyl-D-alanine carboxypeptidase family protein n=1 Tax=Ihubacter sp. rT4E-8 TaxID=3242369 RepID=UPI003CF0F917